MSDRSTSRPGHGAIVAATVVAFLSVPIMALGGLLPLPGRWDQPPLGGIATGVLLGVAFGVLLRSHVRGWLALAIGVLAGVTLSVAFQSSLAQAYLIEEWLMTRQEWVIGLIATLLELLAAVAIGYFLVGTFATTRAERGIATSASRLAAVAGPFAVVPLLALVFSAALVPGHALLPTDRDVLKIKVLADGSLSITPTTLPAGYTLYTISNASDRYLGVTMVQIEDETDVDRLLAGDQRGFAFMGFGEAPAGAVDVLGRLELQPGQYAVYVEPPLSGMDEGTPEGPQSPPGEPLERRHVVVITVER